MAIIAALSYILLFNILIIACFIVTVPAAKYCNYGFDISSADSLKNQSCNTEEVYLSSILFATDQNKSPTYPDEKVYYDDENSGVETGNEKNYHCFIFRYIATQILIPDVKKESVHIAFGCDVKNLCQDKEFSKVLFGEIVNGSEGQLFCCDSENCNKVDRLLHLPAENRVCYHGTNKRSEVQTNAKESCARPDVMCAKLTLFSPEGITEKYFCDNDMLCHDQMSSGSFRSCHASLIDNSTQELCCCDTSMCFEPQWPTSDTVEKTENLTVPYILDTETTEKSAASNDGLIITGLIAALVFVTCVGGGIIFLMICKKRRRPRTNPNVIMQYERLSASDPDVNRAVVL